MLESGGLTCVKLSIWKSDLVLNSKPSSSEIASESGRGAEQIVQEIVQTYIDHDLWFRAEVQKGLGQLDGGEFVEHDEVVAQIERMFHP